MDLVIARYPFAIGTNQCGGVVDRGSLFRYLRGIANAEAAGENPRMHWAGKIADRVSKQWITGVKRSWRFRPDDEVGFLRSLGSWLFADPQ